MKVVFSNRAYASVLSETTEKIKTETGGLFLGTVKNDTWYIIEAIDPGPKSIFEIAYFEYDQKYTQHLINKIANLYAERLNLIGLWHRHPGSFDQFSSTDDGTNAKYASMRAEGAISALVNIDPNFRITMYQVKQPCIYKKAPYEIGDHLIPDELLKYKSPEQFCSIMKNLLYSKGSRISNQYHKSISLSSFMKFIIPQLKNDECTDFENNNLMSDDETQELLIEEIIDDLTFMADTVGVETSISLNDNYLTVYQETIDKTTRLHFMYSTAKQAVILSYGNKCYLYHKGLFSHAFEKAKEAKEQCYEQNNTNKYKAQNSVFDAVIKKIIFNRSED